MTIDESETGFAFSNASGSEDEQEPDESRSSSNSTDESLSVPSDLTSLEQLGAASYYYEVKELAVLVDRITNDPTPPTYAEAVLPWLKRYIEK